MSSKAALGLVFIAVLGVGAGAIYLMYSKSNAAVQAANQSQYTQAAAQEQLKIIQDQTKANTEAAATFQRYAEKDSQWVGGGGGTLQQDLVCPSGSWVTKILGKAGSYVDKIGIQCRNGTNSAQYGGGGGADFQMESPLGFDQLDIGSGKYIDSIKGWSSGVTIGSAGGGGGAKNSYTCPGGKVMGLGVRSGTYVDSLRVLCGK